MNRRHFLISLGASCLLAYSKKAQAVTSLFEDLRSRLKRVSRSVYFPGDSAFQDLKTIVNPALTPENPLAIVRSLSPIEIQNALNLCRDSQVPVRVRSGGHSFEGFSMGNGVVFDLRDLKHFAVTPTHVVAGAGLTLGELKEHLEMNGLSFPTGTCPTVGIGGYLLGGGHSIKSRLWGLGADRVQAMRVLLASGERVLVSPQQYSDLYWALLGGGGGNFALVEEFHLDLIPTGQDLIFKYIFAPQDAARVFEFWEQHALTEDKSITVQMLLSFDSGQAAFVQIFGVFNCINVLEEPAQKIFDESIWAELDKLNPRTKEITLVSSNKARKDGELVWPFKGHSHFAEKPIGMSGFEQIARLAQSTLTGTRVSMVFEPLGGAIHSPARANSYPHRDCVFNIEFYAGFRKLEQKDFYSQALTKFHQGMAPLFSGRCYVNYPNFDLKERAYEAYYAQSLSELVRIKRKYDPQGLFNFGMQSLADLIIPKDVSI